MKSYNQFIKESKTDIDSIPKAYGIMNYTINPDGSIDVDGDVGLNNERLTKLPLKFRNVGGDFYCSYNNLPSLEGCPQTVGGDFYCRNNQLTSLEGLPEIHNIHKFLLIEYLLVSKNNYLQMFFRVYNWTSTLSVFLLHF
jgi:hypothetical protein